ncbi:retrovirus-related pol polyprotein from transposon TNT 1-94, partial [Tanacetum coccineum]
MNFQDSPEDSQSVPSNTDLDNLFSPLYEEYYATSSPEVLDNSAANTLDNENTSSSSIIIEEDEAPEIVSTSAEQVATEPNSSVLNENADELDPSNMHEFHQKYRSSDKRTMTRNRLQTNAEVYPDFPKHVYRLKKSLYGLKQAPRAWYDKLSSFLIEHHFTKDADHAGCNDDCKSTSGGIQFLRDKLVSWSSKKQDCTAMSTAEA